MDVWLSNSCETDPVKYKNQRRSEELKTQSKIEIRFGLIYKKYDMFNIIVQFIMKTLK